MHICFNAAERKATVTAPCGPSYVTWCTNDFTSFSCSRGDICCHSAIEVCEGVAATCSRSTRLGDLRRELISHVADTALECRCPVLEIRQAIRG